MGAVLVFHETPKRLLLGLIWVYQSTLGPALPKACRFEPSCSRYAYTAIERHGAIKGTWLAANGSRVVSRSADTVTTPSHEAMRDTPVKPPGG